MVTEGLEERDWLEMEEIPETDRLDEKQEEMGVGRRVGDEELEVLWKDALANSSSVGMVGFWQWLASPGERTTEQTDFLRVFGCCNTEDACSLAEDRIKTEDLSE